MTRSLQRPVATWVRILDYLEGEGAQRRYDISRAVGIHTSHYLEVLLQHELVGKTKDTTRRWRRATLYHVTTEGRDRLAAALADIGEFAAVER